MHKLDRSNEPTMWIEAFFALFSSILRVLEAMSNEWLFVNQFRETAWNQDADNKSIL